MLFLKTISISKFGGIAPIYDGNLKPGMAVVAQDCDLSSGKVKPLAGNLFINKPKREISIETSKHVPALSLSKRMPTTAPDLPTGTSLAEYFNYSTNYRLISAGHVSKCEMYVNALDAHWTGCYIKVWRDEAGVFRLIGKSDNIIASLVAGKWNKITFGTKIRKCEPGDYYSVLFTSDGTSVNALAATTSGSGGTMYSVVNAAEPTGTAYDWLAQTATANYAVTVNLSVEQAVPSVKIVDDDTPYDSIVKYNNEWLYGDDKFYLTWETETAIILVFLDKGTAKKSVKGAIANLGQPAPDAPAAQMLTVTTDITGDGVYNWKRSSTNGDIYCVLINSLDNIFIDGCSSITGWTDGDSGAGAASAQATFDSQSTFKFDSGNAAAGNKAKRSRDIGSFPEEFMVSTRLYFDALGSIANVDYFQMDISRVGIKLSVRFSTDGLYVYDGATWNEVGTDLITENGWHEFSFTVDSTTLSSATCTVSVDSTTVVEDVDCSYTGAFTDGEIVLEQHGDTTANRIAYLDWIKIGAPATPSLAEPDEVKIKGETATHGSIADGSTLSNMEWDFGDKDNLGFDTVYVNVEEGQPQEMGHFEWHVSGFGTNEYYCLNVDGTQPNIPMIDRDFPDDIKNSCVVVNGVAFSYGTVGSLTENQYAFYDNDTLGFRTLYLCLPTDPEENEYTIRLSNVPGWEPREIKTFGESDIDSDEEFTVTHITDPGEINGFVRYLVCTERNVNGHIDKSGPSPLTSEIEAVDSSIRISPPAFSDPFVSYWYIYRLSNASAEYELVAKKAATETYHDDTVADADLGAALDTEYTGAKTGVTITHAAPITDLDGLANDTYSNILFAWKGAALFWCEPGNPDAFPSVYSFLFRHKIRNVIVGSKAAMVLCHDGPYLIEGTHPELLYPSDPLGDEPCLNEAACDTSKGVVYVSDGSLVLANLSGTASITDELFGSDWWNGNIGTIHFVTEIDNRLIVAHSRGTLILDASRSTSWWFTLSAVFYAAWHNPTDGFLYLLGDAGIHKFMGGEDLSPVWQSGRLYGDSPREKMFDGAYLRGMGEVIITLGVDGTDVATKTIDLASILDRDKTLKFPEQSIGRYCQIKRSGSGVVDDIVIGYSS